MAANDVYFKRKNRRLFLGVSVRFFIGMLVVLLGTAFCVELYLQRQTGTTLMNRSWALEDTRIKQNNLRKLGDLDETFPLMATPGGIMPMTSGKAHRIVVIADSFSWGDGLANINDVWWRQIERELERRGYHDVEVLALGWNGAQTREELDWLRDGRFADLKAEAVVLGYVVNDPDMGLLPQDYKVYRMFFVDDVFRRWLPELVEQFQARYMRKMRQRQERAGLRYSGPEEWLKALLEGENFARWKKTVSELAGQLKTMGLPAVMVSLPVVPDPAYYGPLYAKPLRVIAENGIPLLNLLDDYVRDMGEGAAATPFRWTANPANGHPGRSLPATMPKRSLTGWSKTLRRPSAQRAPRAYTPRASMTGTPGRSAPALTREPCVWTCPPFVNWASCPWAGPTCSCRSSGPCPSAV